MSTGLAESRHRFETNDRFHHNLTLVCLLFLTFNHDFSLFFFSPLLQRSALAFK